MKIRYLIVLGVLVLVGCQKSVPTTMGDDQVSVDESVEAKMETDKTAEAVVAVEEADTTSEAVDTALDSLDDGFVGLDVPEESELSDQALEL